MNRNHLIIPAVASLLALALPGDAGFAQTGSSPAKPPIAATHAKADAASQEVMKYSQDGHSALRDIAAARVAIFNGDPKLASDLIVKAKDAVAKAEAEAPSFAPKVSEAAGGKSAGSESDTEKAAMVPVDGEIMLADDFVPTPEKMAHVAKANEHLKNGKSKEALEELRLGEIEVNYTRLLMPTAAATKHIEQATQLMNDHKYYEANLALKAVDDSLVADSVTLTEIPKKKS
jgi:hypothetical protein